ncbi:MAG: hypothetical protein HY360_17440 [Verrucomicrobia bacterium]|nr:hypothetical protein [Verrucomicrobiota bacterium]
MNTTLPAGWDIERIRMMGRKTRVGGDGFRLGHRAQIRAVRAPLSDDPLLLVANELRDIRAYSDILSGNPVEVPMHEVSEADSSKRWRFGYSATGLSDNYNYLAVIPHPDGQMWDLLRCHHLNKEVDICRKRDRIPALEFCSRELVMKSDGVPDVINWNRDGVCDLLMSQPNGAILRLPRDRSSEKLVFQTPGIPVGDVNAQIELTPPIFPCVVDFHARGRSDLLMGTGDGCVMLFEDVGDEKEVRFARSRRLQDANGFIRVKGPACPAVLDHRGKRTLLVADGDGELWAWPIQEMKNCVTTDIFAAFGGEAAGIGKSHRKGAWWMRPNGDGFLLGAGPEPPVALSKNTVETPDVYDPPAPELRLKAPVTGLHEIHVTLCKPDDVPQPPMIEVRLSDETSWAMLKTGEFHPGTRQQIFFKTADLSAREICFRQVAGALTQEGGLPVFVESVGLVPVKLRKPRRRKKPITVAGISDSIDWYRAISVNTPEAVDDFVGKHEQAGFNLLYEKLGGGCWEYPSRIPEAKLVVPDLPGMTEAEKGFCAKRIELHEKINRIQLAAEACHKRGMKCFGWMRLQNHGERIAGKGPLDRLYVEHPEYLEKNIDGEPVPGKLCLGYPQVRAFHVKLIEEAMDLGCDGILMDTMRHLPKVMCGDPIVEEFQKRHGLDMRKLPPFDPRVMELQIEVMTGFLREAREAMRRKKADAELHVRVCKPYPLMGCDPGRWARAGIVEAILIENRSFAKAPDIEGLVVACKGTKCAPGAAFCRPHWGSERMPLHPDRIETEVAAYLRAGARSIAFYETAGILDHVEFSRAIRRINHPDAMPSRALWPESPSPR